MAITSNVLKAACPLCDSIETAELRPYRANRPGTQEVFRGVFVRICRDCGTQFAGPAPSDEMLDSYYGTVYRGEGAKHRDESDPTAWSAGPVRARSQVDFVLDGAGSLLTQSSKSWLDVGAGYGSLLDEARARGFETAAIEPDEHARTRLKGHGHRVVESLGQADGNWSVISISHVLEHVSDPRSFVGSLRDRGGESSLIFCEVPNETRLHTASNDAPHLLFFTRESLTRLFESAGFKTLRCQTCGSRWEDRSRRSRKLAASLARKLWSTPPHWIDRAVHPHYHYDGAGSRKWIRLLAHSKRQ